LVTEIVSNLHPVHECQLGHEPLNVAMGGRAGGL